MKTYTMQVIILLALGSLLLAACQSGLPDSAQASGDDGRDEIHFTLETAIREGKLIYTGVGGEIDGLVNPDLVVKPGVSVRITLINGDNMPHDLYLPDFEARTQLVITKGDHVEVTFQVEAAQVGKHVYYCTQPGHRQAGQQGWLIVEE